MHDFWELVEEQNKVKKQLQSISDSRRVPHAFIFSGQNGVGKFNTALQFAKNLYQTLSNSINEKDFLRYDELQEPMIKLILPLPRGKGEEKEDTAVEKLSKDKLEEIKIEVKKKAQNPYYQISIEGANTIKISSIREIKKYVSLAEDDKITRFIIILNSDMMNDQAQNALLKNLEEPPTGIYFILLTSQKDKLLSTIISRCREITFEPLSDFAVAKILNEKFGIEKSIAKNAAKFSEGSVTHAIKLIGLDFNLIQQKTISILRYAFARKYQAALNELIEFSKSNTQDSIVFLLKMLKAWFNDVVRLRNSFGDFNIEEAKETVLKFNVKYNNANVSIPFANLDYLESCINRNINLNVLFLNIIFEIASVVKRN